MDNSVTRRLASFLLAGGLCLTPLIAARAAGPEAISAPPPEELALELWNPLAFLEEEPTAGEEEIPALLLIREGLTEEQQEFYLEQRQIFLRQNRKKESSPLSPVRGDKGEVS